MDGEEATAWNEIQFVTNTAFIMAHIHSAFTAVFHTLGPFVSLHCACGARLTSEPKTLSPCQGNLSTMWFAFLYVFMYRQEAHIFQSQWKLQSIVD
jgi:hypothetical protein